LIRALFTKERNGRWKARLAAKLSELVDRSCVLLTPSGRASLYFLLKCIDKPRVIVPAYTCKAVVEAARLARKEIVFAENEECGFNSLYEEYEKLVAPDCAVIATHQFGIPCDIERICALAESRGAMVIEDAAASLGSRVHGRLTGTFGAAAIFSFDSTKLINVPMKGGAIVTSDPVLYQRLQACYQSEIKPMPVGIKLKSELKAGVLLLLEFHWLYALFHLAYFRLRGRFTDDGPDLNCEKNEFYHYDLAEWQARIALRQIMNLEAIVKQRQSLYAEYYQCLSSCKSFRLPPADKDREWACIRFPILVKGNKSDFYRRAIRHGLDFAFSFTFLGCPENYRTARDLAGRVLNVPFYLKLSRTESDEVIAILRKLDSETN
jgi:dTDP-4-amino-4,6-dideoxygalactose transaminase